MKLQNWLRISSSLAGAAVLAIMIVLATGMQTNTFAQNGFKIYYNFGLERGDYKDFDLAQPNWELCRNACAAETACLSFTYTIPIAGDNGRPAHCWLKNIVPRGEGRDWCISGVKEGSGGNSGQTLSGTWTTSACDNEFTWAVTFNMNPNGTFTGSFSDNAGGGRVENGRFNGSYIEFDRVGDSWQQHWSAQISNSGGKLQLINGIWTGYNQYRYPNGRNNWRAEKR